eukprot:1136228-Pelagomonas_calceolata.AAC.8
MRRAGLAPAASKGVNKEGSMVDFTHEVARLALSPNPALSASNLHREATALNMVNLSGSPCGCSKLKLHSGNAEGDTTCCNP